MIERKIVAEQLKEFQIQEFVTNSLNNVGHSHTKLQRTPLGEKIIIYASRPGLVVGRKGENIKKLTISLKKKFNLENPQIEISEVENIFLDAQIVSEIIASTLERFGPQKFKGVGHKMMADIMKAGALGVEILISGKIPGARAKSWRFYQGYLKKCGDVALGVKSACTCAHLKAGSIGIRVKIMPPDLELPDKVTFKEDKVEEPKEEEKNEAEEKSEKKEEKPKKKKAARKKKAAKIERSSNSPNSDKNLAKKETAEKEEEEKPAEEKKEEPKPEEPKTEEKAAEEKSEGEK